MDCGAPSSRQKLLKLGIALILNFFNKFETFGRGEIQEIL